MSQADIKTTYMGLTLNSPVVAAASDYTFDIENILRLEQAGIGAVVLKSLFEEQIAMDVDAQRANNMFETYSYNEDYIAFYARKHAVDSYLNLIRQAKQRTAIPVIASIHCSSVGKWAEFARLIEQAGADALELNIFILPSDPLQNEDQIQQKYFGIIEEVRKHTTLPVAVKMHYYFTGLANFMVEMGKKANALVLFNRFFNTDIDIDALRIGSAGTLSSESDNFVVQRWLGILSPVVSAQLAASGGVHHWQTVAKDILAGASIVQIATALYKNGPAIVETFNRELQKWMQQKQFDTIASFRGKLNYTSIQNPGLYERAQFMRYFADGGK